jgi:hypothetical protein
MNTVEVDGEDSVSVDSYDPENIHFSDSDQEQDQSGSSYEDQDLSGFKSCVSERGGGLWSASGG